MPQEKEEGMDVNRDPSYRSTKLFRKPLFAQTSKLPVSKSTVSKPTISSERHFKKMSVATSGSTVRNHASVGLDIGQVIEHERFGIGDVINIEGSGDQCKATVEFRNAGTKQLLLKFARFKVIR
jgi:DNA helicase-2/ATP-dependent DNA helicase PcrA